MNQETKKHLSPWIAWSIVALVAGATGFAVWYYWNQIDTVASNINITAVKKTDNSDKTKTTADTSATATWKTYTNDTLKFSFKYPKDWQLTTREINDNNSKQIVYITNKKGDAYLEAAEANIDIILERNKKASDLYTSDSNKVLNTGETAKKGEAIINGITVPTYLNIYTKPLEGAPGQNMKYYFESGNDTIVVSITSVTEGLEKTKLITNDIINTFQFTK